MSVITPEMIATSEGMADGLVRMAAEELSRDLSQIAWEGLSASDARLAAHEMIYDVMSKYANVGQVAGKELYDSLRATAEVKGYYDAVTYGDMEDAVEASARYAAFGNGSLVDEGDYDAYVSRAQQVATSAALVAMRQTMLRNAVAENSAYRNNSSNGVRYARVIHAHTNRSGPCAFCVMLASRGFVYATERSAGAFDRWHNDCTCTVIPSWGKASGYDGYRKYADMYDDATSDLGSGERSEAAVLAAIRKAYGLH